MYLNRKRANEAPVSEHLLECSLLFFPPETLMRCNYSLWLFCLGRALFQERMVTSHSILLPEWQTCLQVCKWEKAENSLEILTSVWMKQPFHNSVDLKQNRHSKLFSTWGGFLNMFNYRLSPSCHQSTASETRGNFALTFLACKNGVPQELALAY